MVDADVTGEELDKSVKRELSTLRAEASESAAKHLVMIARLLDEDPDGAYAHAEAARKHGPRVAVIREAVGLAAYSCGKWAEALAELRAARRISGDQDHWPMMADCERALGRPDKALQMAAGPEVDQLTRAGKVEMRIVAAGARADLGQLDAAVVTLQCPELKDSKPSEWAARLRYAYAAALEAVGRHDEARDWYVRAADADPEGLTDAAERVAELDGVVFLPDEEFDLVEESEAAVESPTEPEAAVESPTEPEAAVESPTEPEAAAGVPTEPAAVVESPVEPEAAEETVRAEVPGETLVEVADEVEVLDPAQAPVQDEPATDAELPALAAVMEPEAAAVEDVEPEAAPTGAFGQTALFFAEPPAFDTSREDDE